MFHNSRLANILLFQIVGMDTPGSTDMDLKSTQQKKIGRNLDNSVRVKAEILSLMNQLPLISILLKKKKYVYGLAPLIPR